MTGFDLNHTLLAIVLALVALASFALLIALAFAITTIFEIYALARTVRREVSAVGTALRAVGEGVSGKASGIMSVVNALRGTKAKAAPKKKA